jgi:hypothetical protein
MLHLPINARPAVYTGMVRRKKGIKKLPEGLARMKPFPGG